jgi:hypothetical protein
MEIKDIILFTVAFAALGFSIYRKYIRKNQQGQQKTGKIDSSSAIISSTDDDYEPYSKK